MVEINLISSVQRRQTRRPQARVGLAFVFFIVLFLLLGVQSAFAVDLYAWRAVEKLPPLVIPVKRGENPQDVAKRYVDGLMADPELKELFGNKRPALSLKGEFRKIDQSDFDNRVLLVANAPTDYSPKLAWRVPSFLKHFNPESGVEPYLLPVAHDAGLSEREGTAFRKQLTKDFEFVVGMGGQDVDPDQYGEEPNGTNSFNTARDESEARFLREFLAAKKGFYTGICRGGQMMATILGYKMIQDIPDEVGRKVKHDKGSVHDVELLPVKGSWLRELFAPKARKSEVVKLKVNSWHHQAVDLDSNPDGPLILTAQSSDGVHEAYQSRDGRILLFQFHPEIMDWKPNTKAAGRTIMDALIETKKRLLPSMCRKLFSALNPTFRSLV